MVYIDAITIVFEEASKGGQPSALPIACIEAGNDHSLPNLALRLFSALHIINYFFVSCLIAYAYLSIAMTSGNDSLCFWYSPLVLLLFKVVKLICS